MFMHNISLLKNLSTINSATDDSNRYSFCAIGVFILFVSHWSYFQELSRILDQSHRQNNNSKSETERKEEHKTQTYQLVNIVMYIL